jgi:hypothetical protein
MPLHLLKLCVGCDSIEDLEEWIEFRLREMRGAGKKPEHRHTTRMVPKRVGELLDGGSLYWVIRGSVQVRQRLLDIRPFRDAEGIQRCHFVLDPEVTPTQWQPRRAFQGWRYLAANEAPRDLGSDAAALREIPAELRRDLADLGLL